MYDDSLKPARTPRFAQDHLLDAARDLFHSEGYHAAQIATIAERAGTTKPTLYARVGDKEAIYLRVIEREMEVLTTGFREVYARAGKLTLHEFVEAAFEPIFRFARERPAGFELLFRSEPGGPGNDVFRRKKQEFLPLVARAIQARFQAVGAQIGSASAGALAAACVGMAIEIALHAADTNLDMDQALQLLVVFAEGAFRNLDVPAVRRIDRRARAPRKAPGARRDASR
jgi:AcrR family transcriptional regulator